MLCTDAQYVPVESLDQLDELLVSFLMQQTKCAWHERVPCGHCTGMHDIHTSISAIKCPASKHAYCALSHVGLALNNAEASQAVRVFAGAMVHRCIAVWQWHHQERAAAMG